MSTIKNQKEDYWSRDGAGSAYEKGVTANNGILMIKNQLELDIVLRNARGSILDAGTGTGRFAINLAKQDKNQVTALDFSQEMLSVNRAKAINENLSIRYIQGDIQDMPFDDSEFDAVVSITVLRHFPEFESILKELIRVLKPGGKLIFEMCSKDHMDAANAISPRFGVTYLPKTFENYEAEVSSEEIIKLLDDLGVKVEKIFPYDFLNNNNFIKLISINEFVYKINRKIFEFIFRLKFLRFIYILFESNILRRLPTSSSYNFMVIAIKDPVI